MHGGGIAGMPWRQSTGGSGTSERSLKSRARATARARMGGAEGERRCGMRRGALPGVGAARRGRHPGPAPFRSAHGGQGLKHARGSGRTGDWQEGYQDARRAEGRCGGHKGARTVRTPTCGRPGGGLPAAAAAPTAQQLPWQRQGSPASECARAWAASGRRGKDSRCEGSQGEWRGGAAMAHEGTSRVKARGTRGGDCRPPLRCMARAAGPDHEPS